MSLYEKLLMRWENKLHRRLHAIASLISTLTLTLKKMILRLNNDCIISLKSWWMIRKKETILFFSYLTSIILEEFLILMLQIRDWKYVLLNDKTFMLMVVHNWGGLFLVFNARFVYLLNVNKIGVHLRWYFKLIFPKFLMFLLRMNIVDCVVMKHWHSCSIFRFIQREGIVCIKRIWMIWFMWYKCEIIILIVKENIVIPFEDICFDDEWISEENAKEKIVVLPFEEIHVGSVKYANVKIGNLSHTNLDGIDNFNLEASEEEFDEAVRKKRTIVMKILNLNDWNVEDSEIMKLLFSSFCLWTFTLICTYGHMVFALFC